MPVWPESQLWIVVPLVSLNGHSIQSQYNCSFHPIIQQFPNDSSIVVCISGRQSFHFSARFLPLEVPPSPSPSLPLHPPLLLSIHCFPLPYPCNPSIDISHLIYSSPISTLWRLTSNIVETRVDFIFHFPCPIPTPFAPSSFLCTNFLFFLWFLPP